MSNWTGMQFVSPLSQVCKFTLRELSSIRDNLYNCLVSELSFNYSMYKEVSTVSDQQLTLQPTQNIRQDGIRSEVIYVSTTNSSLEQVDPQNIEN